MKISVIVPCYNAINKVNECLYSLINQTLDKKIFEVIFIDDCSNDGTYEFINSFIKSNSLENFQIFKLNENSGSPSKPRNLGVQKSKGEYIFFLDADDSIFDDTLEHFLNFSLKNDVDIIRGYLISDNGNVKKEFNRLDKNFNNLDYIYKIKSLVKNQTLTPPQLIRRKFLMDSKVLWREDIRMGEDAIYALELFVNTKKIYYIDHPTYLYNQKVDASRLTSTQTYGKRELENHLVVWDNAEKQLEKVGLSFYELRLRIAVQSIVFALLKFYTYDIDRKLFSQFSKIISNNIHYMELNKFSNKFVEIIEAIKNDEYDICMELIKPKLLIAGYDLKFILPAIPYLEKYYSIKVDEWQGHEIHDKSKSQEFLRWADIIWCEWLLGNAVWYANNKLEHQKIVVRVHRFELTTKYINLLDFAKIDKFFTVSLYFFEKFIEKSGVEREKVRLLPNYLILDKYQKYTEKSKIFNIGMIGILPSRKGYEQGLIVLNELVKKNTDYVLHIYGKHPRDLSWIRNNKTEMDYYQKCEDFIHTNNLEKHVIFHGWTDIPKEIGKIGYILSVSNDEEIPESFHLAPAEAFAAGNIGLFLPWRGVEYIYPKQYILSDVHEIVAHIDKINENFENFENFSETGVAFVEENYSIQKFISNVHQNLTSI